MMQRVFWWLFVRLCHCQQFREQLDRKVDAIVENRRYQDRWYGKPEAFDEFAYGEAMDLPTEGERIHALHVNGWWGIIGATWRGSRPRLTKGGAHEEEIRQKEDGGEIAAGR